MDGIKEKKRQSKKIGNKKFGNKYLLAGTMSFRVMALIQVSMSQSQLSIKS
jgi:hypothetical protein